MYEGYLRFGDTEIINSARAKGYVDTHGCAANWLQDDCDGMAEALGDGDYVYDAITDAPWYDPRNPESTRFLGVTGVSLDRLSDSTRYAEATEGILDGGIVGPARHAGKTFRARVWLTGEGHDALEYGQAWIAAAISNRGCLQHDLSCGGASVDFFTDCLPGRGTAPGYTEWQAVRTNLATDPSFEGDGPLPAGTERSTEWAASGTHSLFVPFPAEASLQIGEAVEPGIYPLSYLGEPHLTGDIDTGLYDVPEGSQLVEVEPGIYELEA